MWILGFALAIIIGVLSFSTNVSRQHVDSVDKAYADSVSSDARFYAQLAASYAGANRLLTGTVSRTALGATNGSIQVPGQAFYTQCGTGFTYYNRPVDTYRVERVAVQRGFRLSGLTFGINNRWELNTSEGADMGIALPKKIPNGAVVAFGKPYTDDPSTAAPLSSGTALTGLTGTAGTAQLYTLSIPQGTGTITVTTTGGTGDVDLDVWTSSTPGDCGSSSTVDSNSESITLTSMLNLPGTLYVRVNAVKDYDNVTLTGTLDP